MTLALSAKFNFVSAAEIANFAAGLVVAKVGTATITAQELRENIKDFYRKK
jgi:bifunctional ADP-heptose synthase (sugar kinase/adenylyltransferase)